MTWIRLRSRRDPAVWLPVLSVILVCGVAAFWVQLWLSGWLEAIDETASTDPEAAVSEAIRFIRLCEIALCAISVLFAGFLYAFFRRGAREERLPPSGWWSLGAWRALVGPAAQRASRVGVVLAALLPVLTAAAVLAIELLLLTLTDGAAPRVGADPRGAVDSSFDARAEPRSQGPVRLRDLVNPVRSGRKQR